MFGKILERIFIVIFVIAITAGIVFASGNFINKKAGEKLQDGCPSDMVFVPSSEGGFCIDRYEASASEDCQYKNELNIDKTRVNLRQEDCFAASKKDAHPWNYISRDQAALACAKAGKRLPAPKEWYQAALGTPDYKENLWSNKDCQVDGNWEEQPGRTGSGIDCVSAVGAYDMVGNVWEWIDGIIIDGAYQNINLPEKGFVSALGIASLPSKTTTEGDIDYNFDYFWIKKDGTKAIARGGSWVNKEEAGQYSIYAEADADFIGRGIGFRCVK